MGIGSNTPVIIKYPFWRMTHANEKAVYACLNYNEAYAPSEIAERSICIDGDTGEVLELLLDLCKKVAQNESKAAKTDMKTEKRGNNWTAFFDPGTGRYFAEIMYTSREGREQYDYEITEDIYDQLGTFHDDIDNERLIKTAKKTYSFENTMYGTLGPERTVWDEEADEAMKAAEAKKNNNRKKKN